MRSMVSTLTRPFTVLVEGNIGSGKSTFLEHFQRYKNVAIYPEPIHEWRNLNGHNLLAKMYEDPKKWSFSFQTYVQLTMMQQHSAKPPRSATIKVMERSTYSARYCFVEKLHRDGLISGPAVSVYDEWFKWLRKNTNLNADLIVYLRTDPEVVYERILNRNRAEEKCMGYEYVVDLHKLHEEWLIERRTFELPAPVLIIDGNLNKLRIDDEFERCENYIFDKTLLKKATA